MPKNDRDSNETKFQREYAKHAKKWKLDPNPRAPEHHYDYKSAILAGAQPDKTGHWPSKYKLDTHPNLVIKGVNTKTGKPTTSAAKSKAGKK